MIVDINIVAYEGEFLQLLMLLRSLNKFVDFPVHVINIVTQEPRDDYKNYLQEIIELQIDTGKFRVEIRCQCELLGAVDSQDGWRLQQVLKLYCSRNVGVDFTMLLDTKNHLIGKLKTAHLFSGLRALYFRVSERAELPESQMRRLLDNSYQLFGLDSLDFIDDSLGAMTPYVIHNRSVNSMFSYLNIRHPAEFVDVFIAKDVTEFFSYNAFLRKTEIFDSLYQASEADIVVTIWGDTARNLDELTEDVTRVKQGKIVFLGLHKTALEYVKANSNPASRALIDEIEGVWLQCGLVQRTGYLAEIIERCPLSAPLHADLREAYACASDILCDIGEKGNPTDS